MDCSKDKQSITIVYYFHSKQSAPKALALEVVRARKPDAPLPSRRTGPVQKNGKYASLFKREHPSKHLVLAKDTTPTCTIYGYSETVKLR